MDKYSFTPEEGDELLLAVLEHVNQMADKCLKALDMLLRTAKAARNKLPWYFSDKKRQVRDPVNRDADRKDEEYKLHLAALLAEDYKTPDDYGITGREISTGLRFYLDTGRTLGTPDARSRPAFYLNEYIPKLLIIDERMSEAFFKATQIVVVAAPFITNKARMRKTNLTRRDGTDQDVLATIEKLKAGDPEDRERYTKTGLAGAIFKALPGPLPTQKTIENSLKRLFFDHRPTIDRGQKFSLRAMTE